MARETIPMRKTSRKIQAEVDVDELLRTAEIGRIGTYYEGEPYIVPVNYVYQGGSIYFHSALEGKKNRNLRANPLVCFEVDEYHGLSGGPGCSSFVPSYASVVAYGRARLVDDDQVKEEILNALMGKYAPGGTYEPVSDPKDLRRTAIWQIEIEEKVGKRRPN